MLGEKLLDMIGNEINICDFQSKLYKLGFLIEEESEYVESMLNNECHTFTHTLNDKWNIVVDFDVTILADKNEENIGASYIKINDIY